MSLHQRRAVAESIAKFLFGVTALVFLSQSLAVAELREDRSDGERIRSHCIQVQIPKLAENRICKTIKKITGSSFLNLPERALLPLCVAAESCDPKLTAGFILAHLYARSLYQHGPPVA